jgi:predicted ATPase
MLTKIHLERFRGFKQLDAEIDPVTVVIGPNSSGKTTLLHAVRVALSAVRLALQAGPPRVSDKPTSPVQIADGLLLRDHTELLPVADWRALFLDLQVTKQSFVIELEFRKGEDRIESIRVEVAVGSNDQLKVSAWVTSAPLLASFPNGLEGRGAAPLRRAYVAAWLQEHMPLAVFVPAFYGVAKDEEFRSSAMLDRLLGAGDQSHIVRNLVIGLDPDALKRLNAFLGDAMPGTSVSLRTSRDEADETYPLRVEFRDTNGGLELSSAGAGLINLIALYASLERYRGEQRERSVIFLFDEPEAHLHPRLQGDVAIAIANAIRSFGAQCLLATHSVEIVNRLSYRPECALLRVDRTSEVATVLKEEHQIVEELQQWVDLTPFTSINLLASRQIIFHEGKTDRAVLRRCADVLFRNNLRAQDSFRRWHFAELGSSSNARDVDALTRLLRTRVFKSADATNPVRVFQVLDRDYERAPGTVEEASKDSPVRVTRCVWSAHSIESLFLSVPVLAPWIRAALANPPADLAERIAKAIGAADASTELNDAATNELSLELMKRPLPKGAHKEGWLKDCLTEARDLVREEPAKWQQGKARARLVLGHIREGLAARDRNQFPVEIHALLQKADPNLFGDLSGPIPREVEVLLGAMVGIAFMRGQAHGHADVRGVLEVGPKNA